MPAAFLIAFQIYYIGTSILTAPAIPDPERQEPPSVSESVPISDTEPPPKNSGTITMAGDVMIYGKQFASAKTGDNTYDFTPFFSELGGIFRADCNIINLETPIDAFGDNQRISPYPYFNAPKELLPALESIGVDVCNIANNHMIDFGFDGFLETAKNIDASDLERLGGYTTPEEAGEHFIKEINGIRVGFVSYTWSLNGNYLPKDKSFIVRMGGQYKTLSYVQEGIREIKQAGAEFVVVSLHWGAEFSDTWAYGQPEIAKALCEAGADVIMGHHPHVVQPIRKMRVTREDGTERESLVIYSLGNFFGYQRNMANTDQGMVVSVKFDRGDDGLVYITDSYYIPTFLRLVNEHWDSSSFRLIQLGQAVESGNDTGREAQYYGRIKRVVGDVIPCYGSIDDAPF